jgi:hypothetical protein
LWDRQADKVGGVFAAADRRPAAAGRDDGQAYLLQAAAQLDEALVDAVEGRREVAAADHQAALVFGLAVEQDRPHDRQKQQANAVFFH